MPNLKHNQTQPSCPNLAHTQAQYHSQNRLFTIVWNSIGIHRTHLTVYWYTFYRETTSCLLWSGLNMRKNHIRFWQKTFSFRVIEINQTNFFFQIFVLSCGKLDMSYIKQAFDEQISNIILWHESKHSINQNEIDCHWVLSDGNVNHFIHSLTHVHDRPIQIHIMDW